MNVSLTNTMAKLSINDRFMDRFRKTVVRTAVLGVLNKTVASIMAVEA